MLIFCWLLSAFAVAEPRVVLISVDGLRPEFYLDSRWPAPCLQSLARQGAAARAVYSVFPSITYANHTSLVTGVSPNRHGIDCNVDFDWRTGPTPGWNWEAERIQAPTLWELAGRRKISTAAFSWPVSVGARVDYLIPEIFSVPGANLGTTEELLRQTSTPGLLDGIQRQSGLPFPLTFAEWDNWLPAAVGYTWRSYHPQLSLIHMLNLDWTQHRYGPDSLETRQAVSQLDASLQKIVEQVDLQETVLMVAGDHGFLGVDTVLAPNRLFYDCGWIELEAGRIKAWKVYARSNGGSAAIYCKDPDLLPRVRSLLRRYGAGRWTLLERDELDARRTFARASLAISVAPGLALGQSVDGPFETPTERRLGQHGHLPELLPTGWIVVGPGIAAGRDLGSRSLLEVAPSIGKLLGLDCSSMEAEPLELFP
ncbi:MAG: alkaline phosphatase family protein [Candidatus Eremiobacteraeota bacterium]|nr:alkaline phosphatase family protein [Candidatus Eremiobacteraeota bacterium]